MRKMCKAGVGVLVCATMLAGCGTSLEADDDLVYVDKKGAVTSIDVESLDENFYDADELQSFVDEEVADYNDENGKDSVKVESLTVEDGTAKLQMKYKTTEDYTTFNGIELYQGTVVASLADGYSYNGTFAKVEDGEVTGTATKEEIYAEDDLKVVIIKANTDVEVAGKICYVSTENVKLTGNNTVSIRDGYSLTEEETADEAVATEEAATEAEVDAATDSNDDTTYIADNDSFETEVYTFIVYK